MTIVAVCTSSGSQASTTTSVLLASAVSGGYAAFAAECDPSGGDIAAWAELPASPSWASAVSGTDRTWAGVFDNLQELPSGLRVMTAPARPLRAGLAVGEAARGFAGLLAAMPEVVTFADCGRVVNEAPLWARSAQLTLLVLRQAAGSAPATVARVDRTIETLDVLRGGCRQVGVVLIGGVPYPAREIAAALDVELFGVLPEDGAGAAQVAGAWSVTRRVRTPLARGAEDLMSRVLETVYGRGHQPDLMTAEVAG